MTIRDIFHKYRGNLRQEDFAVILGVSHGALANWELNHHDPKDETVARWKSIPELEKLAIEIEKAKQR